MKNNKKVNLMNRGVKELAAGAAVGLFLPGFRILHAALLIKGGSDIIMDLMINKKDAEACKAGVAATAASNDLFREALETKIEGGDEFIEDMKMYFEVNEEG